MKCDYCKQPATRNHRKHDDTGYENVCEIHYPHNELNQEEIKICEICKEKILKIHKHHTNYFPEKTIIVCLPCHKAIHNKKNNLNLLPPLEQIQKFYSKVK